MPQFDPSTFSSQIFWLFICLGTLIGAFVFIFLPRINSLLENRSKRIRQDLEHAESLNKQVEELFQSREERLLEAQRKADVVIQEILKEMETKKIEQLQAIDIELAATIQNVQNSIEKQKQTLQTSLKGLVSECVLQILPKLIGGLPSEVPSVKKTG